MKKIAVFLWLFCLAAMIWATDKVTIADAEPFWYVFMEFQGSHSQAPEKIPAVLQELGKQQLHPRIKGHLFGIYFQRGSESEESRWGLGFMLSEKTTIKPPLKIAEYDYKKIVRYVHVGPYESIGNAFNLIYPAMEEKGFERAGPCINIWLDDDPNAVPPHERRTEILLPVKKTD